MKSEDKDLRGFSGLSRLVSTENEDHHESPHDHHGKELTGGDTGKEHSDNVPIVTQETASLQHDQGSEKGDVFNKKFLFVLLSIVLLAMWTITANMKFQPQPDFPARSQQDTKSGTETGKTKLEPDPRSSKTGTGERDSHDSHTSSPPNTKSSPVSAEKYVRPLDGDDRVLRISNLRWCFREEIRLAIMREYLSDHQSDVKIDRAIDEFNELVDKYNRCCGSYRYDQTEYSRAKNDVASVRKAIVTRATRDARMLGNL